MDAYIQQLEETLKLTTVPDSATIKAAVAKLSNELFKNEHAVPAMAQLATASADPQLRQLAAVELRKLVNSRWDATAEAVQMQVRDQVLLHTFTEQTKLIWHQLARVVAVIAENELEKGKWPELMQGLVDHATGRQGDAHTKDVALYVLYAVFEASGPADWLSNLDDFVNLFLQNMTAQLLLLLETRVTCVLALDTLGRFLEDADEVPPQFALLFQQTIPSMVQVFQDTVQAGDVTSTEQVCNVLNNLLMADLRLVGSHLEGLVRMMLEVACNTEADEELRVMALRFLVLAVAFRKLKLTLANLGRDMTIGALRIAAGPVDVDEELNNEDEENENEELDPAPLALRLLLHLASDLPVRQTVTVLFEQLPQYLALADQFHKRGALLAVGVMLAGAPDYVSGQLAKVIPVVVAGLKDELLVVRVAALRCLGQITLELQDSVAEYHEQLLPLIIAIIDLATNVMVYKYATYALDALVEFILHEAMGSYLEPLMNKLFHMLSVAGQNASLKSAIVLAIGLTAYALGKMFIPFFPQLITGLEPFIANAANVEGLLEQEIELRACTFENISTMARAVGSEPFAPYAGTLVEAAQTSINLENLRIRESGFAFINNMAKVYGKEFAAMLPNIVPKIWECLKQKEFEFDLGDEDEFEDLEEEDLANKFTMHSGITIEKEIAAVALGELAMGCGNDFAPYVEQLIEVLLHQVEDSFGMHEAALAATWKIVEAMLTANVAPKLFPVGFVQGLYVDANLLLLITTVRDLLLGLLTLETEPAMVGCVLDSVYELMEKFGPIIMMLNGDSALLNTLCENLMELIKNEHPCQVEDFDEMPAEEMDASEQEAAIFETALTVLEGLAKAFGADFNQLFVPFKDLVFGHTAAKLRDLRLSATGVLAAIAEGLQENNGFADEMMAVFLERLRKDKSIDVKGGAAYGIGSVVAYAPKDFSGAYPEILQLLAKLLSKADKQADLEDEEKREAVSRAYANACGCVARMTLRHPQLVPLPQILPALFVHLPLQAAYEENLPIFRTIMALYEQGNTDIEPFTPQVVEVFAQVFQKELAREKLVAELTLGREENLHQLNQFKDAEEKAKVVELLRFLDSKYGGIVKANAVLAAVL